MWETLHQGRDGCAGIECGHLFEIIEIRHIGQVRIAAVVASQASLVDDAFDRRVIGRLCRALAHPGQQSRPLLRRQHGRHRSAQCAFQNRPLSSPGIRDHDVFVRKHDRIASGPSGIGEINVQQGEQVPQPENQQHAGKQNPDAVWKLGIVAIESMGRAFVSHGPIRRFAHRDRQGAASRVQRFGPKLFHLPGTMMKTTGRPFWRA